jgi:hypothetical protein
MAAYYADFAMKAQNPSLAMPVAAAMTDPAQRTATVGKLQQAIDARARGKK